jgi:hypothetical protein
VVLARLIHVVIGLEILKKNEPADDKAEEKGETESHYEYAMQIAALFDEIGIRHGRRYSTGTNWERDQGDVSITVKKEEIWPGRRQTISQGAAGMKVFNGSTGLEREAGVLKGRGRGNWIGVQTAGSGQWSQREGIDRRRAAMGAGTGKRTVMGVGTGAGEGRGGFEGIGKEEEREPTPTWPSPWDGRDQIVPVVPKS